MNLNDHDKEDIESILNRIKEAGRGERRRRTVISRLKTSAIVLGCAAVCGISYFLFSRYVTDTPASKYADATISEIWNDKPVLKLANDERVLLAGDMDNYPIETGGNINITADSGNTVRYEVNPGAELAGKEPEWDQMIVPRCGLVRLELADGTTVHINSSSTLEFPRFFSGDKRIVKLTGEAYFEVKHDLSRPFIVETRAMNVTALGTGFNVCSYEGESFMAATLVEGSVAVSAGGGNTAILSPGQQAFITGEGALATRYVNVAMYTSWMQGKYIFKDSRLEDICSQAVRWYDTKIYFALEELKDTRFTGVIFKERPISDLIGMLEKTGCVRFKQYQNGYVIMADE